MNPLAQIISAINISRAKFEHLEVTAPWGVRSTRGFEIKLALILRGSCLLKTPLHSTSFSLSAGDIFIMLDDDAGYALIDRENSGTIDCTELKDFKVGNTARFGGGGARSTLLLGRFGIDRSNAWPIAAMLPSFLHLHLNEHRAHSVQSVLTLLSDEVTHPGIASKSVFSRLCEVLFTHTLPACANEAAMVEYGWLAGIFDGQIGETIQRVHRQLDWGWTVGNMASTAGMPVVEFATRFRELIGQDPLEYLTQWRVRKAGILITQNGGYIPDIARAVGYDCASTFNEIFRNEMGISPGELQREVIASRRSRRH